ncbi:conserved protein of unknown function [Limnospira indica PCC 8005]|uniref:Uncharacterized protein n=1 Tax=Limnospira indica PCC 8005 TaxID=376219 RepID=A0A9P1P2Z4_9CYAN|nr:conserved protein of unknown function [Limnospira indica PCC 8005]
MENRRNLNPTVLGSIFVGQLTIDTPRRERTGILCSTTRLADAGFLQQQ